MKKYYIISFGLILFGLLLGWILPSIYMWWQMSDALSYILPTAHAALDFAGNSAVTSGAKGGDVLAGAMGLSSIELKILGIAAMIGGFMIFIGFAMLCITIIVHIIKAISGR